MGFKVVHSRIGSDIWVNARLNIINGIINAREKTILDLGCGKGYVGGSFVKDNNVIFAEIDPSLIKEVEGIRVILNAIDMPFKQSTFDYVICADVLEHIKNDRKVMQNIYKILKEGGRAVIAVPAYRGLYGHHDMLLNHYRRYNRKDFFELAKETGFRIIYSRYACSLLFFPFVLNQILVKSNKAYKGNSKIEKILSPLLNAITFLETNIKMPFGIGMIFVLEK